MNREAVLEFVKHNPVSHMATVENGEPRVRAMHIAHVDDAGLTFCTGTLKPVCKQLLANPSVELAFWGAAEGVQVRVRGVMDILDDPDLKKQIVNETFTFLKPVVEQHGYDVLALFRLSQGTSLVWRSALGHAPPETETF